MKLKSILNYKYVSENIASSGQPEADQFKLIAKANYKLVINLAMPDSENAIPKESYIVTSLGMSYYPIPVPFDAPNIDQLKEFISMMRQHANSKVWVHCAKNYRVSAFLYLYFRLIEKWDQTEAKKVMLESWVPDKIWLEFMQLKKSELF